jgi:hypothetical protein
MVAALQRHATAHFYPDPQLVKFGVRVRPSGPGAFTVIVRDIYGKQRWVKIGSTDAMKIEEAREIARDVIKRIERGDTPFPPAPSKPDSVEAVAREWLKRHVAKNKLRTAAEITRVIEKYILPVWKTRDFVSIKRSDIAALLDAIEDQHGAHTARWQGGYKVGTTTTSHHSPKTCSVSRSRIVSESDGSTTTKSGPFGVRRRPKMRAHSEALSASCL